MPRPALAYAALASAGCPRSAAEGAGTLARRSPIPTNLADSGAAAHDLCTSAAPAMASQPAAAIAAPPQAA